MCYSALVDRALKKAEKEFQATINYEAFREVYRMRAMDASIKIPDGMEIELIAHSGQYGAEIKALVQQFKQAEQESATNDTKTVREQIRELEEVLAKKQTKTTKNKLRVLSRRLERLKEKLLPSVQTDQYRIYPFYFAPVIFQNGMQREIVPMRYRILPRSGIEVPGQYNVFNARRDSLSTAKNWKPLFGAKHALFPFVRFFEWVERDNKKVELSFSPDVGSMWAACLYEEYEHPQLGLIRSFAIVTDDPPREIAETGHDRCPVFIRHDLVQEWLNPANRTVAELDALLRIIEPVHYSFVLAA